MDHIPVGMARDMAREKPRRRAPPAASRASSSRASSASVRAHRDFEAEKLREWLAAKLHAETPREGEDAVDERDVYATAAQACQKLVADVHGAALSALVGEIFAGIAQVAAAQHYVDDLQQVANTTAAGVEAAELAGFARELSEGKTSLRAEQLQRMRAEERVEQLEAQCEQLSESADSLRFSLLAAQQQLEAEKIVCARAEQRLPPVLEQLEESKHREAELRSRLQHAARGRQPGTPAMNAGAAPDASVAAAASDGASKAWRKEKAALMSALRAAKRKIETMEAETRQLVAAAIEAGEAGGGGAAGPGAKLVAAAGQSWRNNWRSLLDASALDDAPFEPMGKVALMRTVAQILQFRLQTNYGTDHRGIAITPTCAEYSYDYFATSTPAESVAEMERAVANFALGLRHHYKYSKRLQCFGSFCAVLDLKTVKFEAPHCEDVFLAAVRCIQQRSAGGAGAPLFLVASQSVSVKLAARVMEKLFAALGEERVALAKAGLEELKAGALSKTIDADEFLMYCVGFYDSQMTADIELIGERFQAVAWNALPMLAALQEYDAEASAPLCSIVFESSIRAKDGKWGPHGALVAKAALQHGLHPVLRCLARVEQEASSRAGSAASSTCGGY